MSLVKPASWQECANCAFWRKNGSRITVVTNDGHEFVEAGYCRKNAPSALGFPVTPSDDWCGEYSGAVEQPWKKQ